MVLFYCIMVLLYYSQIAIHGYSFCVASCAVVKLILRNIARAAVKDSIVRFLLFLGEICIVAVVGKSFVAQIYMHTGIVITCDHL